MNYRIFLVEDDRSIADGLRHQLEQWDFAVQVVQNFRGVLGEFTAFDPHLVLMDIMLPCYDGYHWCREIRQGVTGADHFSVLGFGQYEFNYGNEHGRGRFYCQAL